MPAGADTIAAVETAIRRVLAEELPELKFYDHEPRDLDELPAVTLSGMPRLDRSRVDEPEAEVGRFTWTLSWVMRLYVDWQNLGPGDGAAAAKELLGQVVGVFDANQHLEAGAGPGGLVPGIQDTKVEAAVPTPFTDTNGRELAGYECDLAVLLDLE